MGVLLLILLMLDSLKKFRSSANERLERSIENESIQRARYARVFEEDFSQDLLHRQAVQNERMIIGFLPFSKELSLASNEGVFIYLFILGCFGRIFWVLVKPLCATSGIFWTLIEIFDVVDGINGGIFQCKFFLRFFCSGSVSGRVLSDNVDYSSFCSA